MNCLTSSKIEEMDNTEALSAAALYGIDFARDKLLGRKVLVLTGAGISTDSGIPDYRGAGKLAKHPMTYDTFMGSASAQVRYWARSFVGWKRIAEASPNAGHLAITRAELEGRVFQVITQNVDQLHQKAGSRNVIDLHGRLDKVRCMGCGQIISRQEMDGLLQQMNPFLQTDFDFELNPDGDAEVEAPADFKIPSCTHCGGILKPDVVFFGEAVPTAIVGLAMGKLDTCDALLVVGSSLSVNSGLRFARAAARANKPIIILNIGATRADELATAKIEANSSIALERLLHA